MLRSLLGRLATVALLATGLAAAPAPVIGPASADPPVVPPEVAAPQTFRDWQLDCSRGCRLLTVLRGTGAATGPLLRASLAADSSGGWILAIDTPLPLYLPDGLVLALEGAEPRNLPWITCVATGCSTHGVIDPDLLEELRRQRQATVEMTLSDGSHVRLPLSLSGFSAGFAALKLSHAP